MVSLAKKMKEPDHTSEDPISKPNETESDSAGGDHEQRPMIDSREDAPKGHEHNHHPYDRP